MINWLRRRRRERARVQRFEDGARLSDKEVINLARGTERLFSVLIGPTNSAGQAIAWAGALSRAGFPSQSLRISNDPNAEWFDADIKIPRLEWTTLDGRVELAKHVAAKFEAVLIESMRPLFSLHSKRDYGAMRTLEDIKLLKKSKVKSAIVFHGSDIRDTAAHARREPFSPYRQTSPEQLQLQTRAAEFRKAGRRAIWKRIPVFVTTPDLLLDMPRARWLPVAIDVDAFSRAGQLRPCWSSDGPPRVLYQPSKGWLKSADLVAPILARLNTEGIIQLLEDRSVPHAQMAAKIAQADVVIDRFDGVAGVASVEALASMRIVIANIAPWAYKNAEVTPPILHATPQSLEALLRKISLERSAYQYDFDDAFEYARKWHDGTESAQRISKALKLSKAH